MKIKVTNYGNGGPGAYDTYRITWDIGNRAESIDMRTSYWIARNREGWSGSDIVSGATRRDQAVYRAQVALRRAAKDLESAWERGDIDTIARMTHRPEGTNCRVV